ncbi:MAG: NAD-dependent protein deacylase [Lachnospiraceae bacterium]|nr:NAD-dependent protein deacylase [Lachnospiraceae bacterium]
MDPKEQLKQWVEESNSIVFFGGAGVSTESGIPDFRSVDGLYNQQYKFPPETILSHTFFMRNTEEFYRFYRNKMLFPDAKPNAAHLALARLEEQGKLKAVVTQNIDGLHQAAGSKEVWELHGSVHRNYCMRCGKFYSLDDMLHSEGVPKCSCGGTIKPDVVLYEEGLDDDTINHAVRRIREADMLIIGGTSLTVYPAAGLVHYYRGNKLVLINKSATGLDEDANLVIKEPIGEVLSCFLK